MKFVNKKGKELKTIIPDDIMNMVADITERELKSIGTYYVRNGTQFGVNESDVRTLLKAQGKANIELIKKGIITSDMIIRDIESNFE